MNRLTKHKSRLVTLTITLLAAGLAMPGFSDDDASGAGKLQTGTGITGNIVFTPAWEGEWNVVLSFKECGSQQTPDIEDITNVICAGDTLDLRLTDLLDDCTGTMSDTRLMVDCTYAFYDAGCSVTLDFTLDLERQGDALMGSGQWSATALGNCASFYQGGCEEFEITGTWLDADPSDCNVAPSNVADRFRLRSRFFVRPR
jgi:hypothetical protein